MVVPGGQQSAPEARYPYGPGRPRSRRSPWLWAVAVSALALVSAIVVAVGFAFTVGKSRNASSQPQHGPGPASPPALRAGGPFLEPIRAVPRPLWTTPQEGLFPKGSSPDFASANQDTVLVTSLLTVLDSSRGFIHPYSFIALDAATGAKKWEFKAEIPLTVRDCGLSGDSHVMCWKDNILDTASSEGIPPHTTRLVFLSSKGDMRQESLSEQGDAEVVPLRDGFLVFKNPFVAQGAPSTTTAFSGSGERRWTTQSVGGNSQVTVAEELGLFSVGDRSVSQVFQLSDGRPVGDFSGLKNASGTGQQILRANFHAGGFTVENGKRMDVFNAQGKKVNQIAGWRALWPKIDASSETCGKILLVNDSGAIAAADVDSGQILWQLPGRDDLRMLRASCVGEHFLLQIGFEKVFGVYELASGKQVGSIPAETDPTVIGTDGSVVLLRRGGSQPAYDAYDLANGGFVWSSPPGSDGQYLFGEPRSGTSRSSALMGGAIYVMTGKALSRLGQKP